MKELGRSPPSSHVFETVPAMGIHQQELLHLQVVPIFFETFLIVMPSPPFQKSDP
jgi:hypothetical protein